ncbi:MAG: (2Fe-2S) ferredoxin domain-containing protein [Elusimicrobia bacterium]|nr:(2Fe-2S) ferredoxin domain-containing protein [Elusimicrobiota bacterium]
MIEKKIPYRKTVFVCTNVRDDGREACANPGRGGDVICEKLKTYVKEAGLGGQIRVARSGCLSLCRKGPNAFIYPDGVWQSGMREEDIPELIKKITAAST